MAPVTLPISLGPHVCILPSSDLKDLLASSSLPPLPNILQSFSPLPNVTTRTTALVPIVHPTFAIRFSDLSEIEEACREDEEQRAVRTMDWIGARINYRCAKWIAEIEQAGEPSLKTPWWDELKRCVEGDHVPSRLEGWSHPMAVILAVSTTAPNPLQAIAALHSRALEFPPWVDPTLLRYTLIIHPQDSPLSDEEAGALFNAVKKQYGLHCYLLPLSMPNPPPPPVPVPALIPRLPPVPPLDSPNIPQRVPAIPNDLSNSPDAAGNLINGLNTLRLKEQDILQTAKFAREFVMMSLVPWMEKCVIEWNENYSSTRRLPSRLFSSTRRLFGSASPSPAPTHASTSSVSSVSSLPSRSHTYNGSTSSFDGVAPPPQQRRLAEFATILGDFKLAVPVWDSLRKDGKGGSDILPILMAPSGTVPLHASSALASIHPPTSDLPPHAQYRALVCAVRWENGINSADFLGNILEGERWLVWAAGNAEEPTSALLLAHAALLSSYKQARRRAALWYLTAANRLEKCGIKPLTMYFLRKAHQLYEQRPPKTLSPSFWDAEGKSPSDPEGFDSIMSVIEHPLGRLLYTTGDVAGAVRFFLGLLRGTSTTSMSTALPKEAADGGNIDSDKVFLDDFRVAFGHYKSIAGDDEQLRDLKLPFTFSLNQEARVRLPRDNVDGDSAQWQQREDDWRAFWRPQGRQTLAKGGKAAVDEMFWVELVVRNPLKAEVNLASLTLVADHTLSDDANPSLIEVEVINDIVLSPQETRTVSISVKSRRPMVLTFTHVTYDFLSLLPSRESLASRGRRLQDTAVQRQTATYGPAKLIRIEVEEASHKLLANFVDDRRLVLAQGENKQINLWLSNTGSNSIGELWMVAGAEDEIYIDTEASAKTKEQCPATETLNSPNSIIPQTPYQVPLHSTGTLDPGHNLEFSVIFHADDIGEQDLCLLFVYREVDGDAFYSTKAVRHYEVNPILDITVSASPSRSLDHLFILSLDVNNASSTVHLRQVTTLSPSWECVPLTHHSLEPLLPSQSLQMFLGATRWDGGAGVQETLDFVSRKLKTVLNGKEIDPSTPALIDILCSHLSKSREFKTVEATEMRHFVHSGRRKFVTRAIASTHPHLPIPVYPSVFPLYNPATVDVIVFWEIPSQQRSGHLLVSGVTLGAGHAALKDIIEEAETAKVKRSMYAETHREKSAVLDAVRNSEWNAEMNPIVLTSKDVDAYEHDFSTGPYKTSIDFTLRNYSLTHPSRFMLKFNAVSVAPSPDLMPPPYTGRLIFRGMLEPTHQIVVRPKVWITRPGTYGLGGWRLETEVGERSSTRWQTRYQYVQESPAGDRSRITVCDVHI